MLSKIINGRLDETKWLIINSISYLVVSWHHFNSVHFIMSSFFRLFVTEIKIFSLYLKKKKGLLIDATTWMKHQEIMLSKKKAHPSGPWVENMAAPFPEISKVTSDGKAQYWLAYGPVKRRERTRNQLSWPNNSRQQQDGLDQPVENKLQERRDCAAQIPFFLVWQHGSEGPASYLRIYSSISLETTHL